MSRYWLFFGFVACGLLSWFVENPLIGKFSGFIGLFSAYTGLLLFWGEFRKGKAVSESAPAASSEVILFLSPEFRKNSALGLDMTERLAHYIRLFAPLVIVVGLAGLLYASFTIFCLFNAFNICDVGLHEQWGYAFISERDWNTLVFVFFLFSLNLLYIALKTRVVFEVIITILYCALIYGLEVYAYHYYPLYTYGEVVPFACFTIAMLVFFIPLHIRNLLYPRGNTLDRMFLTFMQLMYVFVGALCAFHLIAL